MMIGLSLLSVHDLRFEERMSDDTRGECAPIDIQICRASPPNERVELQSLGSTGKHLALRCQIRTLALEDVQNRPLREDSH